MRRCISVLEHAGRMPIAEGDGPIIAAAGNADRSALLLAAANAVRISLRHSHVVHLPRGLVVPGAPRLSAIHGYDGALIAHQQDDLRIIGIDPEILIIIPAARSPNARPSLAPILRTHRHD